MARGLLAARMQSICWLALSMMWPMPMTVVTSTSPTALGHSTKPADAAAMMAEPIQIGERVVAAVNEAADLHRHHNREGAAAIRPSQAIDRSSSKARYDVVMRT